jgi:TATA-box binding protein (TBP) (component of TFIID and TFIIIB)
MQQLKCRKTNNSCNDKSTPREASEPKISNYKISFHTGKPLQSAISKLVAGTNGVLSVKELHNFAVVRTQCFVYTLNFSGFVNITKLRSSSQIHQAIAKLHKLIHLPARCYDYAIDNITASGAFGHYIPLHKLIQVITQPFPARLTYRPNYFSGASLKYDGGGTIILFTTGTYIIVGARCRAKIQHIYKETLKILMSMLQERTSYIT